MDIEKLLDAARKSPCILCGGHADHAAMFIPDGREHQSLFGAPDGKMRILFYSICESCRTFPNHLERIELVILSGIRKNSAAFN